MFRSISFFPPLLFGSMLLFVLSVVLPPYCFFFPVSFFCDFRFPSSLFLFYPSYGSKLLGGVSVLFGLGCFVFFFRPYPGLFLFIPSVYFPMLVFTPASCTEIFPFVVLYFLPDVCGFGCSVPLHLRLEYLAIGHVVRAWPELHSLRRRRMCIYP